MRQEFRRFVSILRADRRSRTSSGSTGFQTNSGFLFASLKPLKERDGSADQVINRLRAR
jgi:multidrug efflux pump